MILPTQELMIHLMTMKPVTVSNGGDIDEPFYLENIQFSADGRIELFVNGVIFNTPGTRWNSHIDNGYSITETEPGTTLFEINEIFLYEEGEEIEITDEQFKYLKKELTKKIEVI